MVVAKIQNRTADDDWVRSEFAQSDDDEFPVLRKNRGTIGEMAARVNEAMAW